MGSFRQGRAVAAVLGMGIALGCAPGRGGPPPAGAPTFAAEFEDSTTLWLLAIDPRAAGVESWSAGSWATYEIGLRRGPVRRITYSILEEGEAGTWVEIRDEWVLPEPAGERERRPERPPAVPPRSVEQLLLPFGPIDRARMVEQLTLDRDGGVRRSTYVHRPAETRERLGFPAGWLWVGREEIATPKGKLPAHHYRKSATNVWVSEQAGPIGLVRAAGRGPLVNLVDWGPAGATSSIPR